ncbi:hypothetical protein CC1G_09659 [Coprinopsis cinerea okayama7|uniref:Uncharacterized protein n=1 Tax=Coprinopsis cinerea (strain Okayama-7 / 130 / ATCC MYA-4618 / FGSC 9003) TaxID=240176 RepID=A8P9E7_COPC7|nr:hypothetical protein CC1G_09659 [Coprinopsis cinerea okayama7\|eukprot:XP_001839756.2 hypothetical protein CC1G_09659 [Coprinopsis cinerea okayama7\
MKFTAIVASLLASAAVASAQLTVIRPSADEWWVARSQNVLEWDCQSSTVEDFTVLIGNDDGLEGLTIPLPIIAIQKNYDCSIVITQDQANQAPGTGYRIHLANIINNTDIYASSEPFEIKPLGSLYPSQQAEADAKTRSSGSAGASPTGGAGDKDEDGAAARSVVGLAAGAAAVAGALFSLL